MKKWLAMLAVVVLAVFAAFAAGCNKEEGKAEEFKYSKVEVTSDNPVMDETMETTFSGIYSGFTLEVSDAEFKLKSGSSETKLQYKKEGEKYVFQGEESQSMMESMNQAFAAIGTVDSVEYYGKNGKRLGNRYGGESDGYGDAVKCKHSG